MTIISGQVPWGQRGRRLSKLTIPDVLVHCDICERWIAHEIRHTCELSEFEEEERRVLRVVKVRELLNR